MAHPLQLQPGSGSLEKGLLQGKTEALNLGRGQEGGASLPGWAGRGYRDNEELREGTVSLIQNVLRKPKGREPKHHPHQVACSQTQQCPFLAT